VPEERRAGLASRLVKVALDFEATLNEPAALQDFAAMTLPTLVVQGTVSPQPTRRICELLAGVLPDAQIATVEGAGHMAPLTHRDAVNTLIAAHLASNSGPLSRGCAREATFSGTGASGAASAVA
jgi:pimeloyl-ACP methyl ester carboxylesterase